MSKPTTHQLETLSKHVVEMEAWAWGEKSWTNGPFTPEQVAVMDAQEVVKHSAAIQALMAIIGVGNA